MVKMSFFLIREFQYHIQGGCKMKNVLCKTGLVLALSFLFFMPSKPAAAEVVDRVIIVVNDEVITQRDFDRVFLPEKERIESIFEGDELEERLKAAEEGIKEHLINTKLAISLAKREKVQIDEQELSDRIEAIRSYYETEQDFLMALRSRGTTLAEFEKELREQMLAQKLVQQEVSSNIDVTPGEIREVFEANAEYFVSPDQARVRTIMLRKSPEGVSEAKLNELRNMAGTAMRPEDFSSLAESISEGPYASQGGDMGHIVPGQMVDEIDRVIFSIEKGNVSDVIETEIGFHVFYVEDLEESRPLEFAEVSDFLREQIFMGKFQEELFRYIKENREKAHISYR